MKTLADTKGACKLIRKLLWRIHEIRPRITKLARQQEKVFCIGLNKTGTTSLSAALHDLGFRLGSQRRGELLLDDWARRDFCRIFYLCYSADAFKDIPFSLPFTFEAIDQHFPNAKFIMSLRDDGEQWYESITRFHSKLWADGKRIPTAEDLKTATYIKRGRPWHSNRLIYNTPETEPYRKDDLLQFYANHRDAVRSYFKHRSGKMLEINVARSDDYARMCEFLVRQPLSKGFPWCMKTDSLFTMEISKPSNQEEI